MKSTVAFIICFLSFVSTIRSQDTIIKRNDEKVIAKILEINQTQVKYKKFNYQDGPLYIESKREIKMIRYKNGQTEEFKAEEIPAPVVISNYNYAMLPQSKKIETWGGKFRYEGVLITENEMHYILEETKDPKIIALSQQSRQAKNLQYIGFGAIPLAVAGLYLYQQGSLRSYTYVHSSRNAANSTYFAFAGFCGVLAVACPIESVICKIRRGNYNTQAIRLYNQKF